MRNAVIRRKSGTVGRYLFLLNRIRRLRRERELIGEYRDQST